MDVNEVINKLHQRGLQVTYRQLDTWIRGGLIVCPNAGSGTGNRREIPSSEMTNIIYLAELVTIGFRPPFAALLIDGLKKGNPIHLGKYTLTRESI